MEYFRAIPGFPGFIVSAYGLILSEKTHTQPYTTVLNDYLVTELWSGGCVVTMPVHRAVALAWLPKPDNDSRNVVNHIDGDTRNNYYQNLEWVTTSENNYHAVNTGLRPDVLRCKIRDKFTCIVHSCNSVAQACEFMGISKTNTAASLMPKKFGELIAGRYEFKFEEDNTPWFYELNDEPVVPRHYRVFAKTLHGEEEFLTKADLLKRFQLYRSPSKSIPALVKFGNQVLSDVELRYIDSDTLKNVPRPKLQYRSARQPVHATKADIEHVFDSLSNAAKFFNVDRSSISRRINNGIELDGWTFSSPATLHSNA